MSKEKTTKIPATKGACADKLYQLREVRHALGRQVKEIEAQEAAIREHLIATLPADEASGVAGKLAKVSIESEVVPTAEDWDKLTNYIKRKGAFELLQKRLSAPAIRERWENKEAIPGIGSIVVKKVSVTKL